MKLTGNDLEVRAVSIKTSKTTGNQYIALRLEDEEGSMQLTVTSKIKNSMPKVLLQISSSTLSLLKDMLRHLLYQ